MGYITLRIAVIILSVVGFVEILRTLITAIYKRTPENAAFLIIPTISDNNNPEFLLRCYAERTRWMGSMRPKSIIFITDNLTDEGKKIAQLICKEYDFIELMTTEEINKKLTENIGKNDCLREENVL